MGVQQAFPVDRNSGVGFPILDPGVFPNGTVKSTASYYQGQPAVDPIPAVRPARLRSSAWAFTGRAKVERCEDAGRTS